MGFGLVIGIVMGVVLKNAHFNNYPVPNGKWNSNCNWLPGQLTETVVG
jgi:hypothetical protein